MTEIAWNIEEEPLLEDESVRAAVCEALRFGGRSGALLAIVFVTDPVLLEMHAVHLNDPTETDVISFDLGEEGEGPVGELYVSVDRARSIAEQRCVSLARELTLYVVHGVLHLCGYDDHEDEDRKEMRQAENEVMKVLGFPPDERPHELD